MFGIGMPELIIIFVIALLDFGPKELPKIGKTIGKAMGEFRRASDELKEGIQREIDRLGKWQQRLAQFFRRRGEGQGGGEEEIRVQGSGFRGYKEAGVRVRG